MSNFHERWKGIVFALLAAGLFGASTPMAKLLLPKVDPVLMAGLLYLGSGIGLAIYWLVRSLNLISGTKEPSLTRRDVPWLAGAITAGGIVGPILLLWGLAKAPASSASLLLNLESLFTVLLAWFVFREHFGVRIALGMGLIAAGGVWLSYSGRPEIGLPWGMLAIAGACLSWAIDNNLTRRISTGDPVQIAGCKGLIAGSVTTSLALFMGAKLPPFPFLLATATIGLFGYGVSLVLFVLALRHIGTARTGAYFSTAPWVGAALSILFLRDDLTFGFVTAALLMGIGVWLHLTEHHEHEHRHPLLEHEHLHSHDEHHQHSHRFGVPSAKTHSHAHQHGELIHAHPHYPDIHHRHGH
jgi:drug/metabolite transporter (DMT)-like permease